MPDPRTYGKGNDDEAGYEEAYVSRLHATMFGVGLRGLFNGTEPVTALYEMMRSTEERRAVLQEFIERFGDGQYTTVDRRDLPTVRLAPRSDYRSTT